MSLSAPFLTASEAAGQLGVSAKTLRLYEKHGMIAPGRTAAGWRCYGPAEMARAGRIVALRALGLGLADVARVLDGKQRVLEPVLANHQASLEDQARRLAATIEKVRTLRTDLAENRTSTADDIAHMIKWTAGMRLTFSLPWPWGGEKFEMDDIRPLNYITGPLGSGKTRLARTIAATLPGAAFLGLERLADEDAAQAQLAGDADLRSRVDRAMTELVGNGATGSTALRILLMALESDGASVLVIDMVEQGLDEASQKALIADLRRRASGARPLFLMTRSRAILDLAAMGPHETVILCPANHNPPINVTPRPGASGYEAVSTCLASPDARARLQRGDPTARGMSCSRSQP